ncbi:MAG TPA: GNAT family N-acetyltransferase [Candidatus Limnocylindrales bacterium]|nr:GNAT family N-acetyltransferase [Candidatus Limnocylindrales bacterium]
MSPNPIQIRQLSPSDATDFRELRLEGLRLNPEAFGSTHDFEKDQPLERYIGWLTNSTVFGAYQDSYLIGTANFTQLSGQKDSHKGLLRAMYVRPKHRRSGAGRQLVQAIIEHACPKVEQLQLAVVSTNQPAIQLYQSLGFLQYGLEKNALKHHGAYSDEILMSLDLLSRHPSK